MKRYTLAIGIVSGLAGILTFASPAAALTPRGCSGALAAGSAPAFKITGTGIGVKLRGEPLTNTSNWEKGISDGASFRLLAQTSGDATGPRANTVWDFVQLADGRQGYIADAWATTPGVANQYYNAVPRCGTATAPAAPAALPKKWVAMGDSYSSGEGNAPFDNGTATSTAECHRSPDAWARLAASASGYQMLHIACSGAVLDDVKYGKSTEKSQIDQLGSLPDGSASLVTITIGGNDMGFSTILGSCRFYVACLTNLPSNQATADNISSRLVSDLIPKIKAKAPNAKIVLVGYPRLFPLNQASTKNCGWLTDTKRSRLNSLSSYFDASLHLAAQRAGITFVSTVDSLSGHELCSADSWINPVTSAGTNWTTNANQGHPNKAGQQAMAKTIRGALGI